MLTLPARHHPACYPSDPAQARLFFREALEEVPASPLIPGLRGILTPHIDFRVSMIGYAQAFRPLLAQPLADIYHILGVGHRSPLEWNLDKRDYLTPFGRAENALDELELPLEPARFFAPAAHRGEHSIEFPLLWLQAIAELQQRAPVRFVPLLCGGLHEFLQGAVEWDDLTDFHQLAAALRDLLKAHGEKIGIIVSIDGCHQGPRFQHPYPVTPKRAQETATWEDLLWQKVTTGSARSFLEWARHEGNERYFDGIGALTLLREIQPNLLVKRTHYEQWLEPQDESLVTFSSGYLSSSGHS